MLLWHKYYVRSEISKSYNIWNSNMEFIWADGPTYITQLARASSGDTVSLGSKLSMQQIKRLGEEGFDPHYG